MIIDADVRLLRARHLDSVCRRQLLLVVERAPERQAKLVAVDRELDELYRLEPSYPFDDVVRRLTLDADERAILALVLAWHLFPELHDDAGVELTVGAALGLLFPGSDRRLVARRLFTDAALSSAVGSSSCTSRVTRVWRACSPSTWSSRRCPG